MEKDIQGLVKKNFMRKPANRLNDLKNLTIVFVAFLLFSCQSDNTEKTFYQNSQLKKEFEVENGQKNGFYREYYKDGTLKLESYYQNDVLEGLSKAYFLNGNLEWKVNFKNGNYHGKYYEFSKDGKIKYEVSYLNGEQDGELIEYFKNGKKRLVNEYQNGKLNGEVSQYSSNGRLNFEARYDSGVLMFYKKYSEDGVIIDEYRNLYIKFSKNQIIKKEPFEIITTYYVEDLDEKKIEWFYSLDYPSGENEFNQFSGDNSSFKFSVVPKEAGKYRFSIDVTIESKNYHRDTVFIVK